jgi:hypothetical protein
MDDSIRGLEVGDEVTLGVDGAAQLLRFVDDTILNTKTDGAGEESERAYFECKLLLELIWTLSSLVHTHSIRHPSHCLPVPSPSGHRDSTTRLGVL